MSPKHPQVTIARIELEDEHGNAIHVSAVRKLALIRTRVEFSVIYWIHVGTEKSGTPSVEFTVVDTLENIYRRRRPEYWWGVAWLPEFWLTVVLSGGLVVSVWRDRKMGKA